MIGRKRARRDGGRLAAAVQGALAGIVGGGAMTAAHVTLKRAGWLDRSSPEAVVGWIGDRTGVHPRGRAGFGVAEQLTHLLYSAALGAGFGFAHRGGRGWLAPGALLGLTAWAANFAGVVPALGIAAPPARARPGQLSGALVAHLLFGAVTALAHADFAERPVEPASSDRRRAELRIG